MSENDKQNNPEQQEGGDAGEQQGEQQNEPRSFSQDELDRIVQDRLAKERKKYEGFDQYKQAADELAQIKDSEKSEVQKYQDQLTAKSDELTTAQADLARYKALATYPVSEDYQDLVHGTDEESYLASAKKAHELEQKAKAAEQGDGSRHRNPIDGIDKRISDKAPDLDSQIAQAESEKNWSLAGSLKAQKLGAVK